MRNRKRISIFIPPVKQNGYDWPWNEETDPPLYDESIDWPKISIVTPTLNQGNFIEETIRSVLLQKYPNLEYIIIDGGSTDNTIDIIKKYEPWLTYWESSPDKGQSNAINKGLVKCTGVIFNWLNSDDYLAPGALHEVALKAIESNYEKAIFGRINFLYPNSQLIREGSQIYSNLGKTIGYGSISQPSTFFPLKFLKDIGGLNEQLHYTMDVDIFIKYVCQNSFYISTDKVLVNFRFHSASKTTSQTSKFNDDLASIYYDIASNDHLRTYQRILKKMYSGLNEDVGTNIKLSENVAKTAVNYFLFRQTYWLYHSLSVKKLSTFFFHLKSVNLNLLLREDKRWLILTFIKSTILIPIVLLYRCVLKYIK